MIEYLFYIISLFLLVTVLLKINNYHLFNDALIFSTITNYLLNFSTSIFYFYFENYLFGLISSILLILFSISIFSPSFFCFVCTSLLLLLNDTAFIHE